MRSIGKACLIRQRGGNYPVFYGSFSKYACAERTRNDLRHLGHDAEVGDPYAEVAA